MMSNQKPKLSPKLYQNQQKKKKKILADAPKKKKMLKIMCHILKIVCLHFKTVFSGEG